MRSQFVYFGKKGYWTEAPGTDETTAAMTKELTANKGGGLYPGDQAADQADGTNVIKVYAKAVGDGSDGTRGSGFGTVDELGATIVSANPKDGEVVRIPDEGFILSSQTLEVQDQSEDGVNGYTMEADTLVWAIESKRGATSGIHNAIQSDICVPMSNYIGADAVAFSGTHWDGSAIDVATLKFKAAKGDANDDMVHLLCTAGKFKEVCQVMEEVANGDNYEEAITMFDLDESGVETVYQGFADRGITIYGVIIEMAAV